LRTKPHVNIIKYNCSGKKSY